MLKTKLQIAYKLSIILMILLLIQSLAGIFLDEISLGIDYMSEGIKAQEIRNLAIVLPIFVSALIFSIKGSIRANLILLGVVYSVLYNNMHMLFGEDYNKLLMIYILIFFVSVLALVYGFMMIDYQKISEINLTKKSLVILVIPVVFFSLILFLMYVSQYTVYIFTDEILPLYSGNKDFESLIPKLNFSFIVFPGIISSLWLFKKKPMGFVLAIIILILGLNLFIVMIIAAVFQSKYLVGGWDLVPLWSVITIYSFYALFIALKSIGNVK